MKEKEKKENKVVEGSIFPKQKKYGRSLLMITIFLIPVLLAALIISSHSHRLISPLLETIIQIVLGLCVGLFIVGCTFFIKNRKVSIPPLKPVIRIGYVVLMIFYLTCESICLVLFYGPNHDFRDWLVTTAMATMNHHYYCEWFYSDTEIEEVFSRNYIAEPDGSTDASPLTEMPPVSPDGVYVDEYEEAILKRDPGTLYKIIRFQVNGCNAYLAVIYDPSKVGVTTTKYIGTYGQYVVEMAQREKAVVAINGAGFQDPGHSSTGGRPTGITIVDGKVVTNNQYGRAKTGGLIGFNKENKLLLLKNTSADEALKMGIIYTAGFIESKSGLMVKHDITSDGLVDYGYTGSIKVKLFNHGTEDYYVRRSDKISQLVIVPVLTPTLQVVDELDETERGEKGFGSSGR